MRPALAFFFFSMGTLWVPIWSKEALWAPAPLMGWVGHPPHMGTQRVPIIGRDLFSFLFFWSLVHSPSARYRLQWAPIGCPYAHPKGVHYNGCPKGHPYVHPEGVHIISRDLLYARVRMPEGQFWPKLSRSRRKFAGGVILAKISNKLINRSHIKNRFIYSR